MQRKHYSHALNFFKVYGYNIRLFTLGFIVFLFESLQQEQKPENKLHGTKNEVFQ